jgi:prevent-host-death family protein
MGIQTGAGRILWSSGHNLGILVKTMPVVEVKSHLSAVLAEVESGTEIAITRHGKIVARLTPEKPKMAADAFRSFWSKAPIDIEAPADKAPEPVADID